MLSILLVLVSLRSRALLHYSCLHAGLRERERGRESQDFSFSGLKIDWTLKWGKEGVRIPEEYFTMFPKMSWNVLPTIESQTHPKKITLAKLEKLNLESFQM